MFEPLRLSGLGTAAASPMHRSALKNPPPSLCVTFSPDPPTTSQRILGEILSTVIEQRGAALPWQHLLLLSHSFHTEYLD